LIHTVELVNMTLIYVIVDEQLVTGKLASLNRHPARR
jgi:hypothetical protein